MSGAAVDRETETRANELYWRSDQSVNQIADALELSKGVLYGLIRPQPVGLPCPDCAEELVYPNRTAKERRTVACAQCGWEGGEGDAAVPGADQSVVLPAFDHDDEDDVTVPALCLSSRRQRTILGGALLGAAAGLALVIWARRR